MKTRAGLSKRGYEKKWIIEAKYGVMEQMKRFLGRKHANERPSSRAERLFPNKEMEIIQVKVGAISKVFFNF